jgi:heme-degrading monooxygenase HmoA
MSRDTNVPALLLGTPGTLVVMSTLLVPVGGADALEQAFRDRLGAVDGWPGHQGLQVWRDLRCPGRYAMNSWWSDKTTFARYMRSSEHAASHARIPHGDHAPVLESLVRYEVLPT